MFVIHNISIATDDDIIQIGDDVNIYSTYLSRAIVIEEIVLLARKDPCFWLYFLSISCQLIWELTYGH